LLIDIPGSEKWSIKDLFQRNIDRDRLTAADGLIAYFTDKNQVKYFNPIALVLLPVEGLLIDHDLQTLVKDKDIEFDNIPGSVLTNKDIFRLFLQDSDEGNIGKLEWNNEKCYVVAIDGQHRLTALKELYEGRGLLGNSGKDITEWQIPVVFIIANKKVPAGESKDLIKIIRKIFMYINMKAERVNDARSILLNDESVECLCVQEIVSAFHKNETIDSELSPLEISFKSSYPPLYLIDWLGMNSDASMLKDTRYLFSNIELRNWVRAYLIGEDFGTDVKRIDKTQIERLDLVDINLDFLTQKGVNILTNKDSEKIRKKFDEKIRGSFIDFLINLDPIKNFITKCREYEGNNSEDITQQKAFSELRYGYAKKENSNKNEVENYIEDFAQTILMFKKETMSEFFRQDINMRGIVYAYSEVYGIYKEFIKDSLDWGEYNTKFLDSFNNLISEGWCESRDILDLKKREILTHLCHDDTGKRINYKIEDVKNAWGIFVVMHVLNHAAEHGVISPELKSDKWIIYRDRLSSTLEKGFRDVVKREVDQLKETEFTKKRMIADQKKERAEERLVELETLWKIQ
jgi:hypothetical protein